MSKSAPNAPYGRFYIHHCFPRLKILPIGAKMRDFWSKFTPPTSWPTASPCMPANHSFPRQSWKTKVCFSHPHRQLCTYFSLIPDCPTSWLAARESGSTVSARGSAGGGSSGQGAERYRKKWPLTRTPEEFNSACQKKRNVRESCESNVWRPKQIFLFPKFTRIKNPAMPDDFRPTFSREWAISTSEKKVTYIQLNRCSCVGCKLDACRLRLSFVMLIGFVVSTEVHKNEKYITHDLSTILQN